MQIDFYRTALCPRCNKAAAVIKQLQDEIPGLEINTIEVATAPIATFRAGIRMIPALKCNDSILSAFILDSDKIKTFIRESCSN